MRVLKEAIDRFTTFFRKWPVVRGRRVETIDRGLNDSREHSWSGQTTEIILDFLTNNHTEFRFNPVGPVEEVQVRCSVASPTIRYRMAKRLSDGSWIPGTHEKHVFPFSANTTRIFKGSFAEFSVQPASSASVYIKASKYNPMYDQYEEGN